MDTDIEDLCKKANLGWNVELKLKSTRTRSTNPVVYIYNLGKGPGMKCDEDLVNFVHEFEQYLYDRHVGVMIVFGTESLDNPGITNSYITQDYDKKWDFHFGNRSGMGILLHRKPDESVEEFYNKVCDFKLSDQERSINQNYYLEKIYKSASPTPVQDMIFSMMAKAKDKKKY